MLNSKTLSLVSFGLLSAISLAVYADTPSHHVLVAPQCLVKKVNLSENYKILSQTPSLLLMETNDAGVEQLANVKHDHSATPCGGFIDVTQDWNEYFIKTKSSSSATKLFLKKYEPSSTKSQPSATKYSIKYSKQVNQLIKDINPKQIWDDLTAFSNTSREEFPDRYANSNTGVKAANWLKEKIEALAKENHRDDISIYTVATGTQYKQPSVVVKIGNSNDPGIVIGGHMDTLSSSWELKPGADDDGSGSMTTLSVARELIKSGMHFKKPIYIIWYAAEEMGLVGSGYVVKDFIKKKIPVEAVLQFDMTGYEYQKDPTMWLITDNVDSELTNFIETLIKTYPKQPVGRTRCGYACSDHASWQRNGFKAAFPFEAQMNKDNPYIHTSKDTIDILSLHHMVDYATLGIAFAVELAEPIA